MKTSCFARNNISFHKWTFDSNESGTLLKRNETFIDWCDFVDIIQLFMKLKQIRIEFINNVLTDGPKWNDCRRNVSAAEHDVPE